MKENYVNRLHIERLKGIVNLDISFSEGLTCLIGPNGVGKSTILHALCCLYRENDSRYRGYRLSEYLTPYQNQSWQGNSFFAYFGDRTQGIHFEKPQDRWLPRQEKKLPRSVVYVGLETCTPAIERETRRSRIRMTKTGIQPRLERDILSYMNMIMSRNYKSCFIFKDGDKEYFGVSEQVNRNGSSQEYCSLSMSAGEQRCLLIIKTLLEAPVDSLILIEELDVLIHERALKSLVGVMNKIISNKPMQIVFSCHNSSIADVKNVAFRCLQKNAKGEVDCLDGFFTYDMYDLSGVRDIKLTVFVEDNLSARVIKKVCDKLNISRFVTTRVYGAIQNSFTVASGLSVMDGNINAIVVLDGDRYRSDEEKNTRMKAILSGQGSENENRRRKALAYLTQYQLPIGLNPEKFIIQALRNQDGLSDEWRQILGESEIGVDGHIEFKSFAEHLGEDIDVFTSKVVDFVAESEEFNNFVEPVRALIMEKLASPLPVA